MKAMIWLVHKLVWISLNDNTCRVTAQPWCGLTQALLPVCQAVLASKRDIFFRYLHFQVVFMT